MGSEMIGFNVIYKIVEGRQFIFCTWVWWIFDSYSLEVLASLIFLFCSITLLTSGFSYPMMS